eukprot:CAMPEP_0116127692 /NCGR_PEP_ID=MMETSP0329-20121206/6971_1 /TAXON_ID=697910 /ORGANISM="Pseudo-nitzschia arenysensis, Strain B593" /LENGTH=252 /DNA_ID=CAMNT_0003621799 /DNA_START=165 /DNA_END=923 /DNA_ORIENTATION=+
MEIRERKAEFPVEIQKAIEKLGSKTKPRVFVNKIEDSLLELIEGIILNKSHPFEEEQLEVAIRFFPNLLWYPIEHVWISGGSNHPIYRSENLIKLVPFVPLYAKLGIESGWYSERERGGLMSYRLDRKVHYTRRLSLLEYICLLVLDDDINPDEEMTKQQNILIDKTCLAAMERLRATGIFKKQDIMTYNLIDYMTKVQWKDTHEKRLRYLVEWYPQAAMAKIREEVGSVEDEDGESPTTNQTNMKLRRRYH